MNGSGLPNFKYEGLKRAAGVLSVVSKVLMILTIISTAVSFMGAVILMALPQEFMEANTVTDAELSMQNYANLTEGDLDGVVATIADFFGIDEDDVKASIEDDKIKLDLQILQNVQLRELGYSFIPNVIQQLVLSFLFFFADAFFKSIARRGSQFGITLTDEEAGVFNNDGLKALRAVFAIYIIYVVLGEIVSVFAAGSGNGISFLQIGAIFILWFATKLYAYLVDKNSSASSNASSTDLRL